LAVTEIFDEPPDENEAFESLDEALDDEDAQRGFSGGPEGQRDLDSNIVLDRYGLEEAGADLDDPDQLSLLSGAMDDPDGSGPPSAPPSNPEEGWDLAAVGASGEAQLEEDDDPDEEEDDPELQITDVDPNELDQVPDDAPGPDSARW